MTEIERHPKQGLVPLGAGLLWLWAGMSQGAGSIALALLPGVLLVGAGAAIFFQPGDRRSTIFGCLGVLAGLLLAIPAAFAWGWLALGLALATGWSGVKLGSHAIRMEPTVADVPAPEPSAWLGAQVAVDEVLLASMTLTAPLPRRADQMRIAAEVSEGLEQFEAAGWLADPAKYHNAPPPFEAPQRASRRRVGVDYEHLSCESGYEPHPGEPGRERWLGYAANRTAHAWVLRHAGPPRPWLVCIHGYQMGIPAIDLLAFEPKELHQRLGMNLLIPVLPLHGPRKIGRRSGDGFLSGEILDTVHAEAQAMWDLRRFVGWLRAEGAPRIGVLGYSLGGYNTALLASLEDDLACAIAGIPATDFSRLLLRHAPPLQVREVEYAGLSEERIGEVLRVVSPLAIPPKLPLERRTIFGGVADRIVPPDQVRDLWRHWEHPRTAWYQGAHVTFRAHPQVARSIEEALRGAELTAPA